MQYIGIAIGLGAALAFILVGALVLFGGADATQRQLGPGFVPDRLPLVQRIAAVLGFWLPIVIVALFCLLAGIQILRVAVRAVGG